MSRVLRSTTPGAFAEKKKLKNTTLINRNLETALAFIKKVDGYFEVFEKEKREKKRSSVTFGKFC